MWGCGAGDVKGTLVAVILFKLKAAHKGRRVQGNVVTCGCFGLLYRIGSNQCEWHAQTATYTIRVLKHVAICEGVMGLPACMAAAADLSKLLQVHEGEEFNTAAAGEDISIQVTFRNPLQIKLVLSRVRLHVAFTPADQAAGAGAPAAAAAGGGGAAAPAVSPEDVLVMESQFSLHPGRAPR